jgi:amino acid transporter/nucleotide-binding universal stress UspA family protein
MSSGRETERTIGLWGATGVGVGAIVGGGILALAGVAFAATGPAAMVAFGVNGLIAMMTALSFAEMASKFPESGGTYTYSKKVLSVEAAFIVGWVVWFASIVAAVLYALGFGYFVVKLIENLWRSFSADIPACLADPRAVTVVALITTIALALGLTRTAAGGGVWANVGKVALFSILIVSGAWAIWRQDPERTSQALNPFFTAGITGLIQAMGYTFIALQGFDLIAAVGGEVREPRRNLPRAMILSLTIALAIYLPLLLVIATVGVEAGQSIASLAAEDPEGIVANAARNYLGPFGFWMVIVAAMLSMFSALHANLFAASRIARAMARDRTLPSRLSGLSSRYGTPVPAILVTTVLVSAILIVLRDVAAAGAATSLIFLVNFAVAHGLSVLVRRRARRRPPPFRVPLFPLLPVVGGVSCLSLAVYQGIAVPTAGIISVIWLGIGGVLFISLFASRARVRDASSTGLEPELVTLRGHSPLVLVPVANPDNAEVMITLADALVPANVGRVLLQTVVVAPDDWDPNQDSTPIERSQAVLQELLRATSQIGIHAETLLTVSPEPMKEIARVAELHRCGSVLLGLSQISEDADGESLESLLGTLDADVVVLRSRKDWQIADAKRILVPIGRRGGHEHLLAQLLGSLARTNQPEVTFMHVLPVAASADESRRAKRDLRHLAADVMRKRAAIEVVNSDDPLMAVIDRAADHDLLILGVQRIARHTKLFGRFARQIAQRTECPLVLMSRRG